MKAGIGFSSTLPQDTNSPPAMPFLRSPLPQSSCFFFPGKFTLCDTSLSEIILSPSGPSPPPDSRQAIWLAFLRIHLYLILRFFKIFSLFLLNALLLQRPLTFFRPAMPACFSQLSLVSPCPLTITAVPEAFRPSSDDTTPHLGEE